MVLPCHVVSRLTGNIKVSCIGVSFNKQFNTTILRTTQVIKSGPIYL